MKSSKRRICQILALVVSGMGASAATTAGPLVQVGGSSLVAPMFAPVIGSIGLPYTEIGLFGTNEATFTYWSVGSGAGQRAFLNNDPTQFRSVMPNGTIATATGTVDFVYSGAALPPAPITAYQNGREQTDGPLIQIPYVVTPITIPIVNGPTVTSAVTPQTTPNQVHSIALNDDDLCGIFSGKLTDWNQVVNPETGRAYATTSNPITVVYRQDDSGETELLTRHLAAVCTPRNTGGWPQQVTFIDSMTFANTTAFPKGVPPNFVSATGDSGVRKALLQYQTTSSAPAAVAYLAPNWTNTLLAPSSSALMSTGMPALQLAVASLVNAQNAMYYAPTAANATAALGTVSTPANPADPTQWVPNAGSPTTGYPVSGTSQIILSQCYASSAVTTAVHDFLNAHYTNASFASIVHGNGFDTVPSNFQQAIVANFLSNTSGNYLDIGNTDICGAGAFPGR
ncbi:substrate-binding domain-containing protein [Trinickia fusca]|uniref:Phosphate ABC transporter substrate-binding protein n=1 Tax=Trinickia fusca TaxID=2419777 RepID=A0A494XY21_9BURK|nr:substrate-binding domain-containing protein [Trinickia fusca]RKP52473.1 phosphate ABC transporter substrate-binding protein [Trinickia fusca]